MLFLQDDYDKTGACQRRTKIYKSKIWSCFQRKMTRNNLFSQIYIRFTNKFPPFLIKYWAFIVKEWNLMFYSEYCSSYCSSCVWHESWSNTCNAFNSTSSYTFSLPLRSLSSMSNSPFLNFWNHSGQLFSLKTASPWVSTRIRCASAANFFKFKN